MSKMCSEMIKLRKWLDENNVTWEDHSYTYDDNFFVHRTWFMYKGHEISVINGRGTSGGFMSLARHNAGYLELRIDKREPVGFLKAKEVEREINECVCYD